MSLVGKRFGRWLVKGIGEPYVFPRTGYKLARYTCECDCGKVKLVRGDTLLNGESTSCGCFAHELAGDRIRTHGLSQHPLHGVWCGILKRCNNPKNKDFKHYGGRGITVCNRWSDPEEGIHNFIADMYDTFQEGLEIDRIDVNGNYCKENCRWATRREQVINRRPTGSNFDTHYLEYNGETLCLSQWADKLGTNLSVISDRITKLNWSIEKTLSTPVKVKKVFIVLGGIAYSIKDVFKSPPNLHPVANKLNKTVHQYCADMFYGIADVNAY